MRRSLSNGWARQGVEMHRIETGERTSVEVAQHSILWTAVGGAESPSRASGEHQAHTIASESGVLGGCFVKSCLLS